MPRSERRGKKTPKKSEPTPKLWKDRLGRSAIESLSSAIRRAWPPFPRTAFERDANRGLQALELRARVDHVSAALATHLPDDVEEALDIAVRAGVQWKVPIPGFAPWPLIDWVGHYGLEYVSASLDALRQLTPLWTAEFAIRPFIVHAPDETMRTLHAWTQHKDEHVRRLASEGVRPRLPWGARLREFQEDPKPVLALLEKLRDDPALYVRRSVANNLNDIAKDHPKIVVKTTKRWMRGASEERQWVVRRALRSLVKDGNAGALEVLGYSSAPEVDVSLVITPKRVEFGKSLSMSIRVTSLSAHTQRLVIDYVVHHKKANGSLAPKTFKLKTLELGAGESVTFQKAHRFVKISTRKYYSGQHGVELFVSGKALARQAFRLFGVP